MKKSFWPLKSAAYLLAFLCVLFAVLSAFYSLTLFYIELGLCAVGLGYALYRFSRIQKGTYLLLQRVSRQLSSASRETLGDFPVPCAVTSESGEIVWYNDLFRDNVLKGNDAFGSDFQKLLGNVRAEALFAPGGADVLLYERGYKVFGTPFGGKDGAGRLSLYYFIDDTELKANSWEYFESRPAVMIILIDNHEELLANAKDSERAQISVDIERALEEFVGETTGFLRKLERSRYIAVLEERHVRATIENRFYILDRVRQISTGGDNMQATLSIGVGRGGKTLQENEHMARQALDMALGRGGDQAAVKTLNGYEFFGGISKGVEKRTKVKTRIVATALTELIEASDNVIVMGHRFGDLDSLGSAVGLTQGVRQLGKPCVIAVDKEKNLAASLIDRLTQNGYTDVFFHPSLAMQLVTKKTLLIITDTHVPTFLESAELYKMCKNVAVVDHHRKMVGHIDNAVIFYHEPYASSASEMVAELLQYFGPKCKITRFEAEALLAGIMLDTKNFVLKTGVRTFEAAAYLRKMGADTVEVRKLFASSMDSYQRKSKIMASSEIYRRCAIATANEQTDDMRIVAPQAADDLLNISDVDASFVLYDADEDLNISARSMGGMNVQLIMEALGGGGHLTMAGAQIRGISLEEGRQRLLDAIDQYYENNAARQTS